MKVVVQRVSQAEVIIQQKSYSSIGPGLLIFLGVKKGDTLEVPSQHSATD